LQRWLGKHRYAREDEIVQSRRSSRVQNTFAETKFQRHPEFAANFSRHTDFHTNAISQFVWCDVLRRQEMARRVPGLTLRRR
jgi:hypothetical protein